MKDSDGTMESMKRMRLAALIMLLTGALALSAQPYEHSVGVRAGYSSGITYKGFFRYRMTAAEVDLLYNRHGLNLTALAEYHLEPFRNKRLLVYLGGGPFGGNWDQQFSAGVSAVAGVEYVVRDLPLHFSADWKPMMNLFREFGIDILDFGVSIRYYFSL